MNHEHHHHHHDPTVNVDVQLVATDVIGIASKLHYTFPIWRGPLRSCTAVRVEMHQRRFLRAHEVAVANQRGSE